jgi:hypothetical protein
MSDVVRIRDSEGEKARRRAAREMIGRFHEEQLPCFSSRSERGSSGLTAARSTHSTSTI